VIDEIAQGDCLDLLPDIPAGSVDLIFTDPPYITALADIYKGWNGLDWGRLGSEFDRILKPSGQVALFADFKTAVEITNALDKWFKFRFFWIWQKPNGQPVNFQKAPMRETELIAVYSKRKSRLKDLTFNWREIATVGEAYKRKFDRQNRTRKAIRPYVTVNDGYRYPREILYFPTKCNLPLTERTSHPTQKPIDLCVYIIKALSNPGDLVCDPFAGSGSIPLAAYRLGRQFLAIERNPDYFRIANVRINAEKSQGNLFRQGEIDFEYQTIN